MPGTASRYALPTLLPADRVNQTPAWTGDVATKLAGIMDGGHIAPSFSGTWRQYHSSGIYQVALELDSAQRRVYVVGLAEHQGPSETLGSTPVVVWAMPSSPSLNPAANVTGMTWGSGGWVRWIVEPQPTGPRLSIMSPGASFGTQHAYGSGDILSMASITWRYP